MKIDAHHPERSPDPSRAPLGATFLVLRAFLVALAALTLVALAPSSAFASQRPAAAHALADELAPVPLGARKGSARPRSNAVPTGGEGDRRKAKPTGGEGERRKAKPTGVAKPRGKASQAGDANARGKASPTRAASASARTASTAIRPIVLVDLEHLLKRKLVSTAAYSEYKSDYNGALSTLAHLSGTRHTELAAVLANVEAIATAKGLTPSRLPLVFLTVQRNREWWANDALLSYGDRVSFPGSRLVWEYYTDQGIEVQWLGTFGEANGYYLAGDENEALAQVLHEAEGLASARAGGIAWEYMFQFDGGKPPWTSSLSQGTAIQAFARAATRLHEPSFQKTAEAALGIFQTPPPSGVRVARKVDGKSAAEYVEYSFSPSDRILNGYIQSLNGLYDFAKLTGSQTGLKLFEEGDAEARTQVPKYNTGAWSMYDEYTESDLGYHELLAEFLSDLCGRTREGEPLAAATSAPATSTTSAQGGTSTSSTGGSSTVKPVKEQIAGDDVYCTSAEEFTADIHTPPVLKLLSHKLPDSSHAGVMFSLSKIATISLTVRGKSGKVVWTNSATVEGGKPRLLWDTPSGTGAYVISATAVDLAGNTASTSGEVKLTAKGN
jgi:hypothetical protein